MTIQQTFDSALSHYGNGQLQETESLCRQIIGITTALRCRDVVQPLCVHVRPPKVGGLALLAALGLFWSPAWRGAAGLAVVYSAAALAISLTAAARTQWALLPVLPVVVWCFHFGYGYGFLRGILDLVLLHNAPDTQFVQLTRKHRPKPGSVRS